MRYKSIEEALFLSRPNRFVAKVRMGENTVDVHVKNTGRCKEILIPGTKVFLEKSVNPNRKYIYDLVAAYKGKMLINIDSQAPNKVVMEWLSKGGYDKIISEYTYGNSRFDFYMEKAGEKYLLEVKGCTLEREGIGYFPDAPTERGRKHLNELAKAVKAGYRCALAYVIQMENIYEVRPNMETDPEYGNAIERAKKAGVDILFLKCRVYRDGLEIV